MNRANSITSKGKTHALPHDFQPGENDVILGRGKKRSTHEGNKRLKSLVALRLDAYVMAVRKSDKSKVLAAVLSQIRTGTPNGKFVKQDSSTNLWFDVGDVLAKEKISQTFRDALVGFYRSSNDFKKRRQKVLKAEKTQPMQQNSQESQEIMNVSINRSLALGSNSLSCSFAPIKTESNSFARLIHTAPVQDQSFEPVSLTDMIKKGKKLAFDCDSLSSSFAPSKTETNSFARLAHTAPADDQSIEPVSLTDMIKKGKKTLGSLREINHSLNKDSFFTEYINSCNNDDLEDIDTSGLVPLVIDSTFQWTDEKPSCCKVSRERLNFKPETNIFSAYTT